MGISVVTGPSTEPVTLAEAKAHLRVAISDDDGLIAGYILAARQYVEGQIHRPIVSRMCDYTIDRRWPYRDDGGVWRTWIDLPLPPLRAVRSITYVDTSGATQTLATNQYTVMTNRPRGAVVPAYDATWPDVRDQVEAITVRFIAGYTGFTDVTTSPNVTVSGPGIPDDLRTAILMHIEMLHDRDPQSRETLQMARDALLTPYTSVSF